METIERKFHCKYCGFSKTLREGEHYANCPACSYNQVYIGGSTNETYKC